MDILFQLALEGEMLLFLIIDERKSLVYATGILQRIQSRTMGPTGLLLTDQLP